ncbi:MAG: alpha/beta hydrolase [Kofleriaceae bacterium]
MRRTIVVTIALACSAAQADPARPAASPALSIERATITTETGEVVPLELGTLRVRENRAVSGSRTIEIGFARLRAARPTQAPPIVFLPGGPGNSYLDAFTETTENARRRLSAFRRYSAVADVIVFDQRGFSRRGTKLQAPTTPPARLDRASTIEATIAAWRTYAAAAAAANPGHDLSAYHVAACVDDVDDLRRALGYPKISLLGGSFGSQLSFAVMRMRPDIVARAVLYGVEPLDAGLDMPSYLFAAIQRIAFDADRAPNLQPYLPAGGLMAAVRELRDRFARDPITVRVRDPQSGKTESVVLGLADLQGALVFDDAPQWPAHVLALYHGHYEDWARAEIASRRGPLFSAVINPLIDAGLGVTAARGHRLQTDPATHYLGSWAFAPHLGSRAAWPTPDVGDEIRAPATSQIPVVMVGGDWDLSTPIENLLEIAPYFPNSRTVIVHRAEHEQLTRMMRHQPEVFESLLEFFRTGSTAKLPAEIALPVPAFVAPSFPPPRRARR